MHMSPIAAEMAAFNPRTHVLEGPLPHRCSFKNVSTSPRASPSIA
jgi:hypothetical protein